jgi:Protein of unknown function (DUF3768)
MRFAQAAKDSDCTSGGRKDSSPQDQANEGVSCGLVSRSLPIVEGSRRRAAATPPATIGSTFDNFTPDNDPHKEHDFGSFEIDGQKCIFKHDYYDKSLQYGSEDPGDPQKTTRVLAIMLADEY